MTIRETDLTDGVLQQLIAFSEDWEKEKSCWGYRANTKEDIDGCRVFLAEDGDRMIGYLFGRAFKSKNMRAVMPEGTACFEVEELYVIPSMRSRGIGKALFGHAEAALQPEAEYMVLSTATKNWRAILHFYLEELGMEFWTARLFKKIGGGP